MHQQFSHWSSYLLLTWLFICSHFSLVELKLTSTPFNTTMAALKHTSNHILFYIIYHDDVSKKKAIEYHLKNPSWTIPVEVRSTVFFESIMYRDFLPFRYQEWEDKDYVGIMSYKVASRTNLSTILNDTLINLESDVFMQKYKYDVIPLCMGKKNKNHTTGGLLPQVSVLLL